MSAHTNLAGIRRDYSLRGLDRSDLLPDPIAQFRVWLEHAVQAQAPEPNAMTLATVDAAGAPAARIVLLKGLDDRGFHFFTNYESDKAGQMEANPRVALVFHWIELERQVRVRGAVSRLTRADTEAYFSTRPRGSRLGAWVSRQSEVLADRAPLERRLAELEKRYPGEDIPAPSFWGGYAVAPVSVEYWQGRPSRLHDRFLYTRRPDGGWRIDRLSP
ncbi:MAG: pyridoxamine 5'-phosphate oxidase [Verrucomicrobia bacterium]|nr:pyridoxamine 5'-phosphate oxidase [Verrucomicrobiota bacterium]MBI3868504.1 pyridoxamine 5'-phosphate oxidase [Verrucomicrobiota bacterium]